MHNQKMKTALLIVVPLVCSAATGAGDIDALIDAARFYDVLGKIASQDPEPAKLLEKYAGAVASPVQLAPMAHVLVSARVNDAAFQALLSSFATAMGKVEGDDRSFTYATSVGKE